ncbi:hypothetical protein OEB96_36440 [Paraliomyxa miuraensis]|nr:hypothetical protein [Paraliomyxa miuraensis]
MLATSAHAAPSFEPPPGWSEGEGAAAAARSRAEAWARAWGGELDQVMSTQSDDAFAETLAIVDVAEPLPPKILTELDAGRSWLEAHAAEALGPRATLEPDTVELLPRPEPGVAVLIGRAQHDDRTAWIAVAPRGARHLGLVLMVPTSEEILYANVFDDAIDGLGGLKAPIAPFQREPLRWGALGAWLVLGLAFGVQWIRRALPRPGARVAGRQAAMVLAGAAAVVLVIARLVLSDSSVELALAGTTPWGLALELAMGGALAALLVLGLSELWARRLQPVASAPAGGSFARGDMRARRGAAAPAEPMAPAITGDTKVGPPPAITGDTMVGPPPAITGNTKIGPPPEPIPLDDGPPVREIISGNIELETQVRRAPEPDTVKTTAPRPPEPDTVKTTAPASPVHAVERPALEIDWS